MEERQRRSARRRESFASAISGVSHGAGGRTGRARVEAGACLSRRSRRVESNSSGKSGNGTTESRLEAAWMKCILSIALMLRRVTRCFVRRGGDRLREQRTVEWSEIKQEVVSVAIMTLSESRETIQSSVWPRRCVGWVIC